MSWATMRWAIPFDDRRLAHARLADQRRVVLGTARQDLDHALDLGLATDHRVEFVLPRQCSQVGSDLFKDRFLVGRARSRCAGSLAAGTWWTAWVVSRRITSGDTPKRRRTSTAMPSSC